MALNEKYIIGLDEVGRGSLAGPVMVAAVAYPKNLKLNPPAGGKNLKLKDSKKLTEKQRNKWFDYIRRHPDIRYAVARFQPSVIDRINIRQAANRAATRALRKLIAAISGFKKYNVLLDGGLYADYSLLAASGYTLLARTIIGGDERYTCIKLASIVAKVKRDAYMRKLHKKLSRYRFDIHKGYGTKAHINALIKYGSSLAHRLTFIDHLC